MIYKELIKVDAISKEDLAYAAGFIEGDGSISIARTKKGTRKRQVFIPAISVSNTNRGIAEWFADLFKSRVYEGKGSWSNKILYIVNLNRVQDAYNFLKAILPYLKMKHRQAEVVIELCEQKLNGEGKRNTQDVEKLEELFHYVVGLNKGG